MLVRLSRLSLSPVLILSMLGMFPLSVRGQTQVAFDNFGPGDSFINNSAYETVGKAYNHIYWSSIGMAFTPSISGQLSSVTVAIASTYPNETITNDLHLYLSDGASGIPGTTLEAFTATNLPTWGSNFTPLTLTSILHPLLSAGNTYYLYDFETGNENNLWDVNSIGEIGEAITEDSSSPNGYTVQTSVPQGAFRVAVTSATPEPGSLTLLFGMASVGIGLLHRRRRQIVQRIQGYQS